MIPVSLGPAAPILDKKHPAQGTALCEPKEELLGATNLPVRDCIVCARPLTRREATRREVLAGWLCQGRVRVNLRNSWPFSAAERAIESGRRNGSRVRVRASRTHSPGTLTAVEGRGTTRPRRALFSSLVLGALTATGLSPVARSGAQTVIVNVYTPIQDAEETTMSIEVEDDFAVQDVEIVINGFSVFCTTPALCP